MSQSIDRSLEQLPPHNIEAEEAVLGSILIDAEAIHKTAPFLRPADFYREKNGYIYEVMLHLSDKREPIDTVTVYDELDRRNQIQAIGGASYLISLANAVPTSVNVEKYGRIVERTSLMRKLISAAGQIAAIGYGEREDAGEALDRAEQLLFSLSQYRLSQEVEPLNDVLGTVWEQIERLHTYRGEITGLRTGFIDLDRLTGGLQKSDLIVLAARPSVGKTALGLSMAHNIAAQDNIPVAVFSLEMSAEQLVMRLLCSESGVELQRVRTGNFTDHDYEELSEAFGKLAEAPIFIDDTANINTLELRTKARRLKAEHNIQLVIVDYLQLMIGRGLENRVQEVSEISRSLKALARELDIPVLALAQLSRAVESRQDHKPLLSDLRDSGSIEQDADVVMFVHREEMYNPSTDRPGITDLIVAKHRNGPIGTVQLLFRRAQARFVNLETQRSEPY